MSENRSRPALTVNKTRRIVLKTLSAGGVAVVALGTGLISPRQVWAAWPRQAFDAETLDAAVQALFDGQSAEQTPQKITIKAPAIAENGAVVPVTVSTEIANAESISVLVENNPSPLAASFNLMPNTLPEVSIRLKMGETSNVIAMVKADGELYMMKKAVKVTIGGCGG